MHSRLGSSSMVCRLRSPARSITAAIAQIVELDYELHEYSGAIHKERMNDVSFKAPISSWSNLTEHS